MVVPSAEVVEMSGTLNAASYPRRPRWRRGKLMPRLSDVELDALEDVLHQASTDWHTYLLKRCFDMGIGNSFEELGKDVMELDIKSMTVEQQRQFHDLVMAEKFNARWATGTSLIPG